MNDLPDRAAGIVFTDGKSILLLKRSGEDKYKGFWDLPGGHARSGESPIQNAHREAMEEIGLKKIPGEHFKTVTHREKGKQYTTFFYLVDKKFQVKLNKEHSKFEWISFDSIKSKNLFPKFEKVISSYLRIIKKKATRFTEWSLIEDTAKSFDQLSS
jgi:8-oxo-dGTP diphosphatase